MTATSKRTIVWVGCALFSLLVLGIYPIANAPDGERGTAYIVLHLVLSAVAIVVWRLARGAGDDAARWIIITGIVARVVLIPAPVFTTHDVDRYLWDGRLAWEGHDPYQTAPDDPAVAHLREQWPTPEEHAAYVTLYPPVSLGAFALSAAFGPRSAPYVWKTLAGLASVASLLLIAGLLYRRRALENVTLIALNPLALFEAGVGAHVDVLVVLAIAWALYALDGRKHLSGGVAIGAGVLAKLTPVVLLAPWFRTYKWRWSAAVIAVVAAGYALAFASGLHPIGSVEVFIDKWRFGSPLYLAWEALGLEDPVGVSAMLGVIGLAVLMLLSRHRRGGGLGVTRYAARRGMVAMGLLFALSPVVFPWYLTPLIPLVAVAPSAAVLAWLTLHPLTYEVLDRFDATGAWQPADWPLALIALGVVAGLVIDGRRALERAQRGRRGRKTRDPALSGTPTE